MSKAELVTKQETTPAILLDMAVEKGADLDKLEKLMDLKIKWEANEAKKAYVRAMTAFKSNPPKIEKDKSVSFGSGKTSYKYATLAQVTEKISKALSEQGLSAAWETQQNGKIVVTCKITHELGHSEQTSLGADADMSGSKNAIQGIGSTITYLQRYTLLALTGLATEEIQDDDAHGVGIKYITDQQVSTILDIIDNNENINKEKFFKYLKTSIKADDVSKIPADKYEVVMQAIKKAGGKK